MVETLRTVRCAARKIVDLQQVCSAPWCTVVIVVTRDVGPRQPLFKSSTMAEHLLTNDSYPVHVRAQTPGLNDGLKELQERCPPGRRIDCVKGSSINDVACKHDQVRLASAQNNLQELDITSRAVSATGQVNPSTFRTIPVCDILWEAMHICNLCYSDGFPFVQAQLHMAKSFHGQLARASKLASQTSWAVSLKQIEAPSPSRMFVKTTGLPAPSHFAHLGNNRLPEGRHGPTECAH